MNKADSKAGPLVRDAREDDLPAIQKIYAHHVLHGLASIKLHERAGFRLVGALESIGFKHGRWLDCVIMQRALGEGDETAPS